MSKDDKLQLTVVGVIASIIVAAVTVTLTCSVWSQGKSGQAKLAEADYSRQVAVREAQAKKDSAALPADAEVLRAKGVAEANKIVAEGLVLPEGTSVQSVQAALAKHVKRNRLPATVRMRSKCEDGKARVWLLPKKAEVKTRWATHDGKPPSAKGKA